MQLNQCKQCDSEFSGHECLCGWRVYSPAISTIETNSDALRVIKMERPKNTQPLNWVQNMKKIIGGAYGN